MGKADPDELAAKREALQTALAAGISTLVDSAEWARYLAVQARFHQYSFGNTLLILAQRPDATRVMAYGRKDSRSGCPLSGWLALGRQVRKGEHGIQIWVPHTVMTDVTDADGRKVINPATGKPRRREKLVGWGIGYVFDVSQTDGEPLPEPVAVLAGEDEHGVFDALAKVAGKLGFTVESADLGAVNGRTEFDPDVITIHSGRPPVQRVKTLAHELAHAILHREVAKAGRYQMERGRCELEAESVAFVVLGSLDMPVDTSAYSFGYVAHWQGATAGDGDKVREAIQRSGDAIQKTAKRIIALLGE